MVHCTAVCTEMITLGWSDQGCKVRKLSHSTEVRGHDNFGSYVRSGIYLACDLVQNGVQLEVDPEDYQITITSNAMASF